MSTDKENAEDIYKHSRNAELLRIATAGSVDDGKSTLIGRLLYESKGIYEDQLASVTKDSKRLKRDTIDLSFVTDGLKAEREQGITIDVAYRFFQTPKRNFIIADTPGHEQYTRNMACGASTADLAIILVDARKGILTQSKRHMVIASLLGVQNIVIAVNKMDLMDYSEKVFRDIIDQFKNFIDKINVSHIEYIPLSALKGDNVVEKSANMPWYIGMPLLSYLENVYITGSRNLVDLRFPVQYVLRPDMNFRGYSGQIASGVMRKGDELLVLPSNRTSRIRSIVTYDGDLEYAFAPQSVTVTLEDEIDITRGDMLVRPGNIPKVQKELDAILVWMDQKSLETNKVYLVKHTSNLLKATVSKVNYRIDPNTLSREYVSDLKLNDIGRVTISLFKAIFCDEYTRNRKTGSFILIDPDTYATAAAGMVIERGRIKTASRLQGAGSVKSKNIVKQDSLVTQDDRASLLKQRPVTLWLTGLSGSGKSTIAFGLEKKLIEAGHICYVLDADNIRHGLNRDLGFSPDERSENIRRIAEVANLLNEAGIIVLASFISPYRADRLQAKEIIGKDRFLEIFVDTPIEICEKRDVKGLYKKARSGLIPEFTGINAPYESPDHPDIHIKTDKCDQSEAVDTLYSYLVNKVYLK